MVPPVRGARRPAHLRRAAGAAGHDGSGGKRWVIPKGIVEKGHSPARSAAKEAWEEAGVTGRISRRMLGRYRYEKWGGVYTVLVYRLDVTRLHRAWPEAHVRRRRWFSPRGAAERLGDATLAGIILGALSSGRRW